MYIKEEAWLLGLGPIPRASALWVKSLLAQKKNSFLLQKQQITSIELSQLLQLENSLEFYNKNPHPTEVLGVSTYITKFPNDFLKIRETQLPNSR